MKWSFDFWGFWVFFLSFSSVYVFVCMVVFNVIVIFVGAFFLFARHLCVFVTLIKSID